MYTFLIESISNYVFKEEKKIDLDSNKTEAITERCSKKYSEYLLFTFKILRAIIMQCTSQWMLLNKSSNRTYIYFILSHDFSLYGTLARIF